MAHVDVHRCEEAHWPARLQVHMWGGIRSSGAGPDGSHLQQAASRRARVADVENSTPGSQEGGRGPARWRPQQPQLPPHRGFRSQCKNRRASACRYAAPCLHESALSCTCGALVSRCCARCQQHHWVHEAAGAPGASLVRVASAVHAPHDGVASLRSRQQAAQQLPWQLQQAGARQREARASERADAAAGACSGSWLGDDIGDAI
jgi:hypothetical protein